MAKRENEIESLEVLEEDLLEADDSSNDECVDRNRVMKQFILAYKQHPELWDLKNENYGSRFMRNKAMNKLLTVLKKAKPDATLYSVRKQLNSLRSNYRKELKRHLASRENLDGSDVFNYIPSNWKFYALRFLDKCDVTFDSSISSVNGHAVVNQDARLHWSDDCEPDQTMNTEDQQEHELEEIDSKVDLTTFLPFMQKKRKLRFEEPSSKIKMANYQIPTEHGQEISPELSAVGTNVAWKLMRMNEDQRNIAELLLNQVLIHGLRNNLTYETQLVRLNSSDERHEDGDE